MALSLRHPIISSKFFRISTKFLIISTELFIISTKLLDGDFLTLRETGFCRNGMGIRFGTLIIGRFMVGDAGREIQLSFFPKQYPFGNVIAVDTNQGAEGVSLNH